MHGSSVWAFIECWPYAVAGPCMPWVCKVLPFAGVRTLVARPRRAIQGAGPLPRRLCGAQPDTVERAPAWELATADRVIAEQALCRLHPGTRRPLLSIRGAAEGLQSPVGPVQPKT